MKIHDLKPAAGSNKRRKRVGRGIGGTGGKTAGRGHKGQRARNTVRVGFEGGQMPLLQRVPKLRGFNNPFRVEYQAINLDTITDSGLTEVSPETLYAHGLIHKGALVKVLGRGSITGAVTVKAHAFSASAKAAIETAGGTTEVLPSPTGVKQGVEIEMIEAPMPLQQANNPPRESDAWPAIQIEPIPETKFEMIEVHVADDVPELSAPAMSAKPRGAVPAGSAARSVSPVMWR